MDLVEAFRRLGPRVGDAAEDARRELAARVVMSELKALAPRAVGGYLRSTGADVLEEPVQVVLVRMAERGPRGYREGDPSDETGVRRFLAKALLNHAVDLQRGRWTKLMRRPDPETGLARLPALQDLVEGEVLHTERKAEAARLEEMLFTELIPAAARRKRGKEAQDRVIQATARLRDIRSRLTSVEAIVAVECADQSEPDLGKARNRFYKDTQRAREAVLLEIHDRADAGELSARDQRGLEAIVDSLRPRLHPAQSGRSA